MMNFTSLKDLVHEMETSFTSYKGQEKIDEEVLARLIQEMLKERHIRMWSAACSTGQEAFSMCIAGLEEEASFSILASDFCSTVLDKARHAVFTDFELSRGLRDNFKEKYFKNLGPNQWIVSNEINNKIEFLQLNLLDDFDLGTRFEIVFLRNILIYQSVKNKQRILDKVAAHMDSGSTLYLGAGESLLNLKSSFEPIKLANAVIYKKV